MTQPPPPVQDAASIAERSRKALASFVDLPTRDLTKFIPRLSDVFQRIIRDTDAILTNTVTDGYARVYAHDHIAAMRRRRFAKVASATYTAHPRGPRWTEEAVSIIQRETIEVDGFREMVYAASETPWIQGRVPIRIEYHTQTIDDLTKQWLHSIKSFNVKDKRRFANVDVDGDKVVLIDDGISPVSANHPRVLLPLDRRLWVIATYANDESAGGYGRGNGARLDRLAELDENLEKWFYELLEVHAGGKTLVLTEKGISQADMDSIRDDLGKAISLAVLVLNPRVRDAKTVWPDVTSLEAFKNASNRIRTAMSQLINGTDFSSMGETGTYGLGAALSDEEYALCQTDVDYVCSHVLPQVARSWMYVNPWFGKRYGLTERDLPLYRGEVDAGRTPKEAMDLISAAVAAGFTVDRETASEAIGLELAEPAPVLPAAPAPISPEVGRQAIDLLRYSMRPGWDVARSNRAARDYVRDDAGKFSGTPGGGGGSAADEPDRDLHRQREEATRDERLAEFGDEGFTEKDANEYERAGVFDAKAAKRWSDAGYSPAELDAAAKGGSVPIAREFSADDAGAVESHINGQLGKAKSNATVKVTPTSWKISGASVRIAAGLAIAVAASVAAAAAGGKVQSLNALALGGLLVGGSLAVAGAGE